MRIQCLRAINSYIGSTLLVFFDTAFNQGLLADYLISRVQGKTILFHSVQLVLVQYTSFWVVQGPCHFPASHGHHDDVITTPGSSIFSGWWWCWSHWGRGGEGSRLTQRAIGRREVRYSGYHLRGGQVRHRWKRQRLSQTVRGLGSKSRWGHSWDWLDTISGSSSPPR